MNLMQGYRPLFTSTEKSFRKTIITCRSYQTCNIFYRPLSRSNLNRIIHGNNFLHKKNRTPKRFSVSNPVYGFGYQIISECTYPIKMIYVNIKLNSQFISQDLEFRSTHLSVILIEAGIKRLLKKYLDNQEDEKADEE